MSVLESDRRFHALDQYTKRSAYMKKQRPLSPHRETKLLLRIALPLVLLSTLALLFSYLEAREASVQMANLIYRPFLEYILAALAVTAAGTVLVEAVARDAE
jgi:hypothetical protein